MATAAPKLATWDELLALGDGERAELIAGVLQLALELTALFPPDPGPELE